MAAAFRDGAASVLPVLLLLLNLGCLLPRADARTCGVGPYPCKASYWPVSPTTPCIACDRTDCCKAALSFVAVNPNPNFLPARWQHCMATVSGQLLVVAGLTVNDFNAGSGYLNDAWATSTGSSWAQRTANGGFPARAFHKCTVVGTSVLVIAGGNEVSDLQDVWVTSDVGATFTQATAAAPFPPRDSFGAVTFLSAVYVVAGFSDGTFLNDVWKSTTSGVSWTQVTPVGAIFTPRIGFGMVVFRSKIWLAGGQTETTVLNELWNTADGSSWSYVQQLVPFAPRNYAVLGVSNEILVFGGGIATLWSVTPTVTYPQIWATYDGVTWDESTPVPTGLTGFGVGTLGSPVWGTRYFTQGSTGTAISPVTYARVVAPTCGSTSFTCPVVSAPLNQYTLCSGAACVASDCCSDSLGARSRRFGLIILLVEAALYTPVTLAQKMAAATGVPFQAIVITYFAPSSLTVYVAVLGSTADLADAGLALILQAALAGTFGPVVTVTLTDVPNPPPTVTTYPTYPTVPIFRAPSTSNPALLALLTLLVIPLAICLGLLCSYARRPTCMPACGGCPGQAMMMA